MSAIEDIRDAAPIVSIDVAVKLAKRVLEEEGELIGRTPYMLSMLVEDAAKLMDELEKVRADFLKGHGRKVTPFPSDESI